MKSSYNDGVKPRQNLFALSSVIVVYESRFIRDHPTAAVLMKYPVLVITDPAWLPAHMLG